MESMMRQAPFVCSQRHRCCHPDFPSTRSRSTYVLPTGSLGSLTRGLVAHASTIDSTLVESHPSLPCTAIAAPRIGHPPVTLCRPSLGDWQWKKRKRRRKKATRGEGEKRNNRERKKGKRKRREKEKRKKKKKTNKWIIYFLDIVFCKLYRSYYYWVIKIEYNNYIN
jgi:hypothetical protein